MATELERIIDEWAQDTLLRRRQLTLDYINQSFTKAEAQRHADNLHAGLAGSGEIAMLKLALLSAGLLQPEEPAPAPSLGEFAPIYGYRSFAEAAEHGDYYHEADLRALRLGNPVLVLRLDTLDDDYSLGNRLGEELVVSQSRELLRVGKYEFYYEELVLVPGAYARTDTFLLLKPRITPVASRLPRLTSKRLFPNRGDEGS